MRLPLVALDARSCALAYALGIALSDFLLEAELAPAACGLAFASALIAGALLAWRRAAAGLLLLAVCAGALGMAAQRAPATQLLSREPRRFDATVCRVEAGPGWRRLTLCGVSAVDAGERLPRRLSWSGSDEDEARSRLVAGTRLRMRARLRSLEGLSGPGLRDRALPARRLGIAARVAGVDPRSWVALSPLPALDAGGPRAAAAARLRARGEGGALFAALALGERSGVSAETRDAFARLGAAHLLAISGLHLALVAGGSYALLRWLLVRGAAARGRDLRRHAWLGAGAVALGYAALSGWGIPVRRALLLLLAGAGPVLLGRRLRPLQGLGFAALLLLAWQPAALFELGAQLSFSASGALLLALATPLPAHAGAARFRRVREAARVSAWAALATTPLLAWHGLDVSWWSVPANLLLVPWTSFVLLPASALAATLAALAVPAAWLDAVTPVAELTVGIVRGLASALPLGSDLAQPHPRAALATGLLALLSLARRRRARPILAALLAALLCSVLPRAAIEPAPPRLVALDVGFGDALLLQGRDAAVLIDAGWADSRAGGRDHGRDVVAPGLAALGVELLDRLIVSHLDSDHVGGAAALLEQIPVGAVWLPFGARADPAAAALLRAAEAARVPARERGRGSPAVRVGDLWLETLWPPPLDASAGGARDSQRLRNERSLVVRATLSGRRILLTGDLGAESERALLASPHALRADLLKVGHHGSRHSSSRDFLAAVAPQVALVSAPCNTRPGLPHRDALARLREAGASVWWTGSHGAVRAALAPRLWVVGHRVRPRRCGDERVPSSQAR